jgi:hypothetical protein
MKNYSIEYAKTTETLPLEGGGKRVGVKGLRRDALVTPHPGPLPQGERGITFDNALSPKGRGEITFDNALSPKGRGEITLDNTNQEVRSAE